MRLPNFLSASEIGLFYACFESSILACSPLPAFFGHQQSANMFMMSASHLLLSCCAFLPFACLHIQLR